MSWEIYFPSRPWQAEPPSQRLCLSLQSGMIEDGGKGTATLGEAHGVQILALPFASWVSLGMWPGLFEPRSGICKMEVIMFTCRAMAFHEAMHGRHASG